MVERPATKARRSDVISRVALYVQALYYIVAGALPLVSLHLFQAITGPKNDLWLVRTVGLLAFSIGVTILSALRRRRVTSEIVLLAVLSAVSFAAIDVVYVMMGRIGLIYLGDAAVEMAIVIAIGLSYVLAHPRGSR
jgi:hypothetical protein